MRRVTSADAVLSAVRTFIDANGYAPSVRELMALTGVRSTSVVDRWLRELERQGRIVREPGVARSIRIPRRAA